MYLDEVLAAQKRSEARGIASICSAHPEVIKQALATFPHPLIEATCNQVNQFGGYTGLTPQGFVAFIRDLAARQGVPFENILLGGDHLGPHVWQREPAASAMQKAGDLVADYARAGFTKIHLDCSMRLADDPPGALDPRLAAARAAQLALVAEQSSTGPLRYVIGTEVPRPGGASLHEDFTRVTEVDHARETLELHRKAFQALGMDAAWERVIALVVQPGVEFGDDSVLPYSPEAARELSIYIEAQPVVYEAHSTDYQSAESLRCLVSDHFAILKVGPALTFAYREAVFALAMLEAEWLPADRRSDLMQVLDKTMLEQPGYWQDYYGGSEHEQALKRKFSLSDRLRYYWAQPPVQRALDTLMHNLGPDPLPYSLSSQFLGEAGLTAAQAIQRRIGRVLQDYVSACGEPR